MEAAKVVFKIVTAAQLALPVTAKLAVPLKLVKRHAIAELGNSEVKKLSSAFSPYEGEKSSVHTVTDLVWYGAQFELGTPAQPRMLLLDTGSSWMWTWADDCQDASQSDLCQYQEDRFHYKNSKTFVMSDEVREINYVSGYSFGPVCTDTISFNQSIRAESFKFFIQTYPFEHYPGIEFFDGIVGLAPRDEASGPLLLEYLYDQGSVPAKQFGIQLGLSSDRPGALALGGYEKQGAEFYHQSLYSFTSTRLGGSLHWEVPVNKLGFRGASFTLSSRFALIDTGSTLITMPQQDWDSLYLLLCAQLESQGVVCDDSAGGFDFLEAPGIASMYLEPISLQIDHVVY